MKFRFPLALILASALLWQPADGARKKAKKAKAAKPPAVATEKQRVAVEKLMAPFKWGITANQVIGTLEKQIRLDYEPRLKKTKDALEHDKLRREMMEKIKELQASRIHFLGKRTPWDVSLVEKEFAHKNNESMLVRWGREDRRFYFFHFDRLWKVYIAFNSDLYHGKGFEDFAAAMENRFGRAERKYSTTIKGDSVMDHMEWPASGRTMMRAIDNTGFYGNFCLVLTDRQELAGVQDGRKQFSPKKSYGDPLVDAVTKGGGENKGDENEDVVDQITGKGHNVPVKSDSSGPAAGSSGSGGGASGGGKGKAGGEPASGSGSKKKKVSKNPLDDLDI
ncbi:MAG: hypothetical protein IT371_02750 [Deltaproteobacteria bacterium]|nr:hypothetical protein [Deltaproteobacteria bacterium]